MPTIPSNVTPCVGIDAAIILDDLLLKLVIPRVHCEIHGFMGIIYNSQDQDACKTRLNLKKVNVSNKLFNTFLTQFFPTSLSSYGSNFCET